MNTDNNKHIIANKIVLIRKLFNITRYFFLSISEISVVFIISSSQDNTNSPNRRFYMNKF